MLNDQINFLNVDNFNPYICCILKKIRNKLLESLDNDNICLIEKKYNRISKLISSIIKSDLLLNEESILKLKSLLIELVKIIDDAKVYTLAKKSFKQIKKINIIKTVQNIYIDFANYRRVNYSCVVKKIKIGRNFISCIVDMLNCESHKIEENIEFIEINQVINYICYKNYNKFGKKSMFNHISYNFDMVKIKIDRQIKETQKDMQNFICRYFSESCIKNSFIMVERKYLSSILRYYGV